jgi:hypothetical protein
MMYESSYRPPVIDLPVFLRDAFIKPNWQSCQHCLSP